MKKLVIAAMMLAATGVTAMCAVTPPIVNGEVFPDTEGNHINAHGGAIMEHDGTYYWYGEHRGEGRPGKGQRGVACYTSTDLRNWTNRGIVLSVTDEAGSPIEEGCIIERPKVIYCPATGRFVMWFHNELKGQGYAAAQAGVATSDNPLGPFKLSASSRVNPGIYPLNMSEADRARNWDGVELEWWTPEWYEAINQGMLNKRDHESGQMSRDMTVFVDDDGKAYHIYSAEENLTLNIAELDSTYERHTGRYIRIFPGGHNEAPAIFKKDGTYWMITSGCTGWAPNTARLMRADSIMGTWTQLPNPCVGPDADITFGGQSTYIMPHEGGFTFMADIWNPKDLGNSRHIWLPIEFRTDGTPYIMGRERGEASGDEAWRMVWSDEFDRDGKPDPKIWSYENGFVRNHELQWYQPENANCRDGLLVIEARSENRPNPTYSANADANDWRKSRKTIDYTSACVKTQGTKDMLYGRLDVRARIPVGGGSWPAIWLLGEKQPWPSCGEIDVMEYYRINGEPHILANAAWGTDKPYQAKWNSQRIPYSHFTDTDPFWAEKFHIWRMDWDEENIKLYLDGELLNIIPLSNTVNGKQGNGTNPFTSPQYLLLNLAIGGDNGGIPDPECFPMKYEIDYVRLYEPAARK